MTYNLAQLRHALLPSLLAASPLVEEGGSALSAKAEPSGRSHRYDR